MKKHPIHDADETSSQSCHLHEQYPSYRSSNNHKSRTLISLLLMVPVLTTTTVMGSPSVNGNVISWPNDGWYQVQTTDGAQSLCSGGSSCTLEPGRYLVINHTNGIRYTDVQVGEAPTTNAIRVTGQVISWPDNGWYQVQSADGKTTYCNGSQSCTVEPGEYLVINHTTGQRFSNIIVGDEPAPSVIAVEGQRISWPDDGWYQVQSADGGVSLCNGADYCDVEPGVYLVINHTTGVRYSGIEVLSEPPATQTPTVINRDNHVELIAQAFSIYTGGIYGDTLPAEPVSFMETHSSESLEVTDDLSAEYFIDSDRNAEISRYACDNGGVLDHLQIYGERYPTTNWYIWDDCQDYAVIHEGTLVDHELVYGGYFQSYINASYSADYGAEERVEISGYYGDETEYEIDPSILRMKRWFNSDVDYHHQLGSSVVEVRDVSSVAVYRWTASLVAGDFVDTFHAFIGGSRTQLSSPLTDNQFIEVLATEEFEATVEGRFDYSDTSPDSAYPPDWTFTSGVLDLIAEDGSALRLSADTGDALTAQVTLLQDDVVIETFQQPWSLWREVLNDVKADPRR